MMVMGKTMIGNNTNTFVSCKMQLVNALPVSYNNFASLTGHARSRVSCLYWVLRRLQLWSLHPHSSSVDKGTLVEHNSTDRFFVCLPTGVCFCSYMTYKTLCWILCKAALSKTAESSAAQWFWCNSQSNVATNLPEGGDTSKKQLRKCQLAASVSEKSACACADHERKRRSAWEELRVHNFWLRKPQLGNC